MATVPTLRVDKVRHAVNAAHLIHQENAQCGARNVTSVETKTTLVLVVGQSRKVLRTVRDHLMVGAQWDTLRVGADSPSRDPEADPTPEVPIVLSWTHFKTILSSMGDSPQMSMRDYLMISMGDTPFKKTLRQVLILSKRHLTLLLGPGQFWVLSNETGSRWQDQDPHNSQHQTTTLKWHRQLASQSWWWCRG